MSSGAQTIDLSHSPHEYSSSLPVEQPSNVKPQVENVSKASHNAVVFVPASATTSGCHTTSLHFITKSFEISKQLKSRKGAILTTTSILAEALQNFKAAETQSLTVGSRLKTSLMFSEFQWQKDISVASIVQAIYLLQGLLQISEV